MNEKSFKGIYTAIEGFIEENKWNIARSLWTQWASQKCSAEQKKKVYALLNPGKVEAKTTERKVFNIAELYAKHGSPSAKKKARENLRKKEAAAPEAVPLQEVEEFTNEEVDELIDAIGGLLEKPEDKTVKLLDESQSEQLQGIIKDVFTPTDEEIEALDETDDGQTYSWHNAATSGAIELVDEYSGVLDFSSLYGKERITAHDIKRLIKEQTEDA